MNDVTMTLIKIAAFGLVCVVVALLIAANEFKDFLNGDREED
jgi:hypothetical protein